MTTSILLQYQTIADISSRMLNLARTDKWDQLVELGQTYQSEVEKLRSLDDLGEEDRSARRNLLTRILDDDANIRRLASPELRRLEVLLGNMKRQQNVLRTYCSWSSLNP
jgi:flagellar protein FliT